MSGPSREPKSGSTPPPDEPPVLAARGDQPAPLVFRFGAHPPFAIRWFGVTSLVGHARNLVASAIAAESIDSRDWMRPESPEETLREVVKALGGDEAASSLAEAMARPVWIDFVADTGDDRDVSLAVARMIFASYRVVEGSELRELPRGDILLFGGDTAYPVGTAEEIFRRVTEPWNAVLDEQRDHRRRVVMGIPGNHDWYDGLDGFGRLFRKDVEGAPEAPTQPRENPLPARAQIKEGRKRGLLARGLHLDEAAGLVRIVYEFFKGVRALWKGGTVKRKKRLALRGYRAVQEATYWSLPLAKGLEMWGVDRQLGRLDFRQRHFFRGRRDVVPESRLLFVAPDPALAFGERWDHGARALTGCGLRMDQDRVFYLTGDMHHYERRTVGHSLHVIAGGGGAFLHGTRTSPAPAGPSAAAYPNAAMTRTLLAQVPLRLMIGRAGFMVHIGLFILASFEIVASHYGKVTLSIVTTLICVILAVAFYINAGHKRAHPRTVALVAVPFAIGLGILPSGLRVALPQIVPSLAGDTGVPLVYAFLGALGFGFFLTALFTVGLEHQQAFAVLGHPGFKHFVRLCVHPDGRVEAWTIGKDDPIAPGLPAVVDRFEW